MKLAVLATSLCLLSAPAAAMTFIAKLDGSQEVPPADTPAMGFGRISITGDIMNVEISYQDLTTPLTVAHIHCCAPVGANAGVAVDLDMIPLPTTLSGSFMRMFDLTSAMTYNAGFLASSGGTVDLARTRLIDAFGARTAYFNLHTVQFPGGEIRGQISAVPEPTTWAMLILGFGAIGVAVRRRKLATI